MPRGAHAGNQQAEQVNPRWRSHWNSLWWSWYWWSTEALGEEIGHTDVITVEFWSMGIKNILFCWEQAYETLMKYSLKEAPSLCV